MGSWLQANGRLGWLSDGLASGSPGTPGYRATGRNKSGACSEATEMGETMWAQHCVRTLITGAGE